MEVLIMTGQLFLSLSILVILHELGHFLPAKWFGARVEKFYLFFDPWFSLFKFKKGDTEYGVGWLPLGGYVKISGMIDESMDTEQMQGEPQPWEFRSKTVMQRIIIMLGGVTVNFLLGMLIMSIIVFSYGSSYIPSEKVTEGIKADSLGLVLGLQDGDKIIKIGENNFEKFDASILARAVILDDLNTFTIERDGQNKEISIPEDFIHNLTTKDKSVNKTIFSPRYTYKVDSIIADRPANKAGIQKNDRIIGVNGISTPYYSDYESSVENLKNKTVNLSVLRGSDTLNIATALDAKGHMGVVRAMPVSQEYYGFGESLIKGSKRAWNVVFTQLKAFGQIGKGRLKAKESVGGFVSIAQMYGSEWDWYRFWNMTAMLSMILGFVNLLPIPALDGGHVMFLLYEVITGRKPSDTFLERATLFGFVLLMGLMLLVNGNEIWGLIKDALGW